MFPKTMTVYATIFPASNFLLEAVNRFMEGKSETDSSVGE